MHIAVVDCGSKRLQHIHDIVIRTGSATTSILLQDANDYRFTDHDAVIISGGPHLFTGESGLLLRKQFDFIHELFIPALGICLGHQAIGIKHRANVFRDVSRRDNESIAVMQPHPLLTGLGDDFVLCADHCEGITCPRGFTVLASSEYYPNEIMANDNIRHYGVQAHPETSGETGRIILQNFLELVRSK